MRKNRARNMTLSGLRRPAKKPSKWGPNGILRDRHADTGMSPSDGQKTAHVTGAFSTKSKNTTSGMLKAIVLEKTPGGTKIQETIYYHKPGAGARVRGLQFSLSLEDIVIPEFCPCCGIKLKMLYNPGHGVRSDSTPSCDRIDLSKGHIPGNVATICWRCNNTKRNSTAETLQMIVRWMRSMVLRSYSSGFIESRTCGGAGRRRAG